MTGYTGNMRSTGSPCVSEGKLRALLKKTSAKRAGKLLNLSRNQLRIIDRAANRTLSFKRIPI